LENFLFPLGAALGVFAATNIDDIVVLTVLFSQSRAAGHPEAWQVWVGQYIGIFSLVAVSGAAALGLTIMPDEWVGLLGLVPVALGVRSLVTAFIRRSAAPGDHAPPSPAHGLLSVAGLTIANGADNVSVYTPLFRTFDVTQTLATLAVFAVMPAVWCVAASWLGTHESVIAIVERHGRWVVPALFILLGLLILLESGVMTRMMPAHGATTPRSMGCTMDATAPLHPGRNTWLAR
jgi:cadmium resistance transport/sequestration family protein